MSKKTQPIGLILLGMGILGLTSEGYDDLQPFPDRVNTCSPKPWPPLAAITKVDAEAKVNLNAEVLTHSGEPYKGESPNGSRRHLPRGVRVSSTNR